ncbi:alpha/beta fold hydrolase [Polyangium mundeleinium]|uniref:Alpha/beta hydrolase n=1 Tax=Polyangium mundeleinium TaxID=2995306 RepID=A0ABT5F2Q6_9BACT|nr:alpha/beta hydrolase [Polyangium mundeleinium]MDC0748386.1 alpha/beta hydrolase [Polyangium mundeleinium]
MADLFYTPSGVRLRRHSLRPGDLNWLLLPGGPGIGSESLEGLAGILDVPGAIWLVDLPGDGSNRNPPGSPKAPFDVWPQVVVEAARALPRVVFAGHSTGGMYLLSTPELGPHLEALALLDTAPDALWHPRFVEMTRAHPLPDVEAATALYEADPRDENIAAVAVASAEWNFTPAGLSAGRELLARMPYNSAAVAWSEAHFDHVYQARWWPTRMPVLRLAGSDDRIVWQGGWHEPRFQTPNVIERVIAGAGHFPWIENPQDVRAAFAELALRIP